MRVGGLFNDLTYWAPTGSNRFGIQGFDAPILIKGRWEDKNEEFTTIGGETIVSRAIALVDRPLLVDGYLANGDLTAQAEPSAIPVAFEIKGFNETPDLRSVTSVRKAVM